MLDATRLAFRDMFSPGFRGVLLKSVALTLGLLIALWIVLQWLIAAWVTIPWPWLDTALSILTGIGLVVGLGFLVAPVAALFAGLFLDDITELVERVHYPADPPGRSLPFLPSLATSVTFLGVVLLINLIALPLVLLLGFGFVIFLAANAYLIGREYFELVALRHHDRETVRLLRLRNSARIFVAGLVIAAFLAVPFANLLAPLFGTAFMVHVFKGIVVLDR